MDAASPLLKKQRKIQLRSHVIALRSKSKPSRRFHHVCRDTNSLHTHRTRLDLRRHDPLAGGVAKPFERLDLVPRHSPPLGIRLAQLVLRHDVALLRRELQPLHGFG